MQPPDDEGIVAGRWWGRRPVAIWLLGLLIALLPFAKDANPAIPFDVAFSEVERQVMFLPETSLWPLSGGRSGDGASKNGLSAYPIRKPDLEPPRDTRCFAFDDEGEGWDVERCRYQRGRWQIDTANTEFNDRRRVPRRRDPGETDGGRGARCFGTVTPWT